jgi:hypothetical protein
LLLVGSGGGELGRRVLQWRIRAGGWIVEGVGGSRLLQEFSPPSRDYWLCRARRRPPIVGPEGGAGGQQLVSTACYWGPTSMFDGAQTSPPFWSQAPWSLSMQRTNS